MKKTMAFLLAGLLICSLFACGSEKPANLEENGTIRIVTTVFPEYDWVNNILGDNPAGAEVILLLDNGVDMHSFQPSAKDILTISTCDLFIYIGGESDRWVEDALKEAVNQNMMVVSLLDTLGDAAKEEETVEGMQEEDGDADESGSTAYDEHVWLSLKNASLLAGRISETLQTLDSEHADIYAGNAEAYIRKLKALDEAYSRAVEAASCRTVLFGDRFPFRYLTDDYGLTYYAAFAGCSAETEASFETILFLSNKAEELSLPAVLTIDGSDRRIAETIVQNTRRTDISILTMDSMQSVTKKDIADGTTYLTIMENNLEVLKKALG